jgi:DNA-binding NarL/FixJ family response regulator
MTILVAEDDPLLRCFLVDLLAREAGFEVLGTVAGAEVREAVGQLRPELLLLDLSQPALCGLQTLEQLAALLEAPAILVLSAEDDDETQLEVARSGARGFVSKEQAVTTLPTAIRAVARGELWYSPQVCSSIFHEYRQLVRQTREQQQPASQLTPRERDVLVRVARGLTNNQIAADLYMSVHTVKLHVQHIFRKLNLPNRTEAAVFAVREGLLDAAAGTGLPAA